MKLLGRGASGYTILEVMIFLAISALIFLGAAIAIGGRQQQVQFSQASRDFESTLQDVINDVSTGFYPNAGTFSCYLDGGQVRFNNTPSQQGSSDQCIVLGKVVQFEPHDAAGTINVYTVVGKRESFGMIVTTLEDAHPAAVSRYVSGSSDIDLTQRLTLRYGLRVSRVVALGATSHLPPTRMLGSIAFLNSFGSSSPTASGSTHTNFTYVSGTQLGDTEDMTSGYIGGMGTSNTSMNFAPGIVICLEEGGIGQRRAAITIGSSGKGAVTKLDFDNRPGICG